MRLLLINPNTSTHITQRMAASAQAALEPGDELAAVTAATGPAAVRTAEQLRQADASAMTMAVAHAAGRDAIILAISLDGAARDLRRRLPHLPVLGMTEAALLTACLRVERVGLLTLGASLLPLFRRRAEEVGVACRMAAYEAVEAESAFSPADPDELPLLDLVTDGCGRLADAGAQAVVLAGAVLCGYADALASRCRIPVLDGVECAVRQARVLHRMTGAGPMTHADTPAPAARPER
jgi:Asp/Glu/hydantoin racemase